MMIEASALLREAECNRSAVGGGHVVDSGAESEAPLFTREQFDAVVLATGFRHRLEDFIADPVHCFGFVCLFADACCPHILSLGHRTVDRRVFV